MCICVEEEGEGVLLILLHLKTLKVMKCRSKLPIVSPILLYMHASPYSESYTAVRAC